MTMTDFFSSPPRSLMLDNVDLLYVGSNENTPPSQDLMLLGLTVSQAAEYAEKGLNVKHTQRTLFGQPVGESTLYVQVKIRKRGYQYPGLGNFIYDRWNLDNPPKVNVHVAATEYHFGDKSRYVLYLKTVNKVREVDRTEERLTRLEKALFSNDSDLAVGEDRFADDPTMTNFRRDTYRRGDTMVVDGHTYIIGDVQPPSRDGGGWALRLDRKFQRSIYMTI